MAHRLIEIADAIREGKVRENEAAYTGYLMEVSGCMLGPQASASRPLAQVAQRVEAVRLLGFMGSRETLSFLADLFLRDPDSAVRAQAARSIGRIGTDPDGVALRAFSQAAQAAVKDEQSLYAAADAIGELCRFSGPPLMESGVKILNLLCAPTMPASLQARARKIREEMKPNN
jgi:HEAT repeat protein